MKRLELENVDIDIEAFDNDVYAQKIMKSSGNLHGRKGDYVEFVGGLTAKTHMEWSEQPTTTQKAEVPGHEACRGSDRKHGQRGRGLPEGQGNPCEAPEYQGV